MGTTWIAAFKVLLFVACGLMREALAGPLLDPAALRQQLQSATPPLLLDASPGQAHARGHIAGAVNVDFFSYGARDNGPAERERWLRSIGVAQGRPIVIYDQGGTYMAPRLFYELLYSGVPEDRLQLLDGGLTRWRAEGGAVTAERTPPPAPGDFRPQGLHEELRVRLAEFLQASGDPQHYALVDALGPDYYYGGAKFFDRGGHVPQALLWPAEDFFNADKTFKPADEIRRMADWLGVRRGQPVFTHCGGGGAAAVPFFALRYLAGFPEVRLYRESQLEWLRDDRGLPFWTYATPALRRDSPWLDTWGGPMLRAIGLAGLSVVDVRPPEAYRQGHVPHALNVGAETFAAHLERPQELASLLGAAGVDPRHEAVIVSDGGLNERSALAFLLLNQLGQRRVSLLMDSVDEWGLRGHPLVQAPTVVGARRSAQDLAVPPAAYPADAQSGVLLRDPGAGIGAHPRVFVATGAEAPQRRPPGTFVHLPASRLVNADGSFKPAAEMWRALEKAGVPRYAELVLFADRPADAAVAFAALRLLGFGHLKVWWPQTASGTISMAPQGHSAAQTPQPLQ